MGAVALAKQLIPETHQHLRALKKHCTAIGRSALLRMQQTKNYATLKISGQQTLRLVFDL
jgi:hypothetical protein